MRRSDREIVDNAEIVRIIESCDVCRLAFAVDNMPYVVPLNFGYKFAQDKLTLYFHCAKRGKKLDMIAANPTACFEMDGSHRLITGNKACDYTMRYESVIGWGKVHVCTERTEKLEAFTQLMKAYEGNKTFEFTDEMFDKVALLKLEATSFSGKRSL